MSLTKVLCQRHLDILLGEAGDRINNLQVTSQPALPPELLPPVYARVRACVCVCARTFTAAAWGGWAGLGFRGWRGGLGRGLRGGVLGGGFRGGGLPLWRPRGGGFRGG